MTSSLKKFRKKLIKNKPPPIVMPGTKNLVEECSLLSFNDSESSNERSLRRNPAEKNENTQKSIESYLAQMK